jgi:hypothetical protein
LAPSSFAVALAFTPDSKTLAAVGLDGVLRFWDPATGDERRRVALDARTGTNMVAFTLAARTVRGGAVKPATDSAKRWLQ